MVKFSAIKGAACRVESGQTTFTVFPDKVDAKERALVSNPIEEFSKETVSWPGEYDFGGIFLRGIGQDDGKQVSFSGTIDNVRCAFVNAPVQDWNDEDLQKLGDVDVLVIAPDDDKKVKALIESVDPRVVIFFGEGKNLQACVKACGVSTAETLDQLKVQQSSLPTDVRQVVVLSS